MGQNKALLRLGDETLAEIGLRKLRAVCPQVTISGGVSELMRFGRVVKDAYPECGPLGGIVSALEQTESDWNLFLPVDAPFLPVEALKLLMFRSGGGQVSVVAEADGRVHPLIGAYSRRALPGLKAELLAGRWGVMRALETAGPVARVQFEDAGWFRNVNSPEEFEEAQKVWLVSPH